MKNKLLIIVFILVVLIVFTQITIFVVQPIGAIPDGKTLIMLRMNKTKFIDSADAMCKRTNGNVNLLCRGMMLSAVIDKGIILFRLPYSETLYLRSTGGIKYSKNP